MEGREDEEEMGMCLIMRLMASGGDVVCFRKSKEARPQAAQIRLVLLGVIDLVG